MSNPNFVDYVKICCRSGKGGAGSQHFIRNRMTAKGGPDGGDGGRGGHVIIRGNKQLWTLLHLKYTKHIRAGFGEGGGAQLRHGAEGNDIFVDVPLGTLARDAETGEVDVEILEDGQTHILVPGGRGGKGNDYFKSPTNRTPRFSQPGEDSIEVWKVLELKLLADIGLVGFPNAGKSTLLSNVSAATPEIADYPFTTLRPNLGMVKYRDDKSFVIADIPGIIEGASEGKGLGLRFLRHIERNSALLFMIAIDSDDIVEQYKVLHKELVVYNPELIDKDKIVAVTKCDIFDEQLIKEIDEEIKSEFKDVELVYISSVSGYGIQKLKDVIWKTLTKDVDY